MNKRCNWAGGYFLGASVWLFNARGFMQVHLQEPQQPWTKHRSTNLKGVECRRRRHRNCSQISPKEAQCGTGFCSTPARRRLNFSMRLVWTILFATLSFTFLSPFIRLDFYLGFLSIKCYYIIIIIIITTLGDSMWKIWTWNPYTRMYWCM